MSGMHVGKLAQMDQIAAALRDSGRALRAAEVDQPSAYGRRVADCDDASAIRIRLGETVDHLGRRWFGCIVGELYVEFMEASGGSEPRLLNALAKDGLVEKVSDGRRATFRWIGEPVGAEIEHLDFEASDA